MSDLIVLQDSLKSYSKLGFAVENTFHRGVIDHLKKAHIHIYMLASINQNIITGHAQNDGRRE